MMILRILFCFTIPFLITKARCQIAPRYFETGNKAMQNSDYHSAAFYYQKAIQESPEQIEYWYSFAEANRMFNHYAEAARGYIKVIQLKGTSQFPLAGFYAGRMNRALGKYEDAIKRYEAFRKKYPRKDLFLSWADNEINACKWALAHPKSQTDLKAFPLSDSINTPFNELNPIPFYGDTLFFSSLQNMGTIDEPAFLSRIYKRTGELVPIPKVSENHIGNGAFTSDFIRFYFTECKVNSDGKYACSIWESEYVNNTFANIRLVSESINMNGYSNTQPYPGRDRMGNEVLYFVSDRPGGKGGMDIWRSRRLAGGSFDTPENLGAVINTSQDEISPFYHHQEKKLYFSSQGHTGYGELDVFYSQEGLNVWDIPTNAGIPTNSPANDMYYVVNNQGTSAYFASNRSGSKFIVSENCCNDLYTIPLKVFVSADTSLMARTKMMPEKDTAVSQEIANIIAPNLGTEIPSAPRFMPFCVYFHNDEPDPRSNTDTTETTYTNCYKNYVNRSAEYEQQWSEGSAVGEREIRKKEIQNWFSNKVDSGYLKLLATRENILLAIQSGKDVQITLGGFCSPLHSREYNKTLGRRRVAAVLNDLWHEASGELYNAYMRSRIKIKIVSLGEEKSSAGVSDSINDQRSSVFSPEASAERRVEILELNIR